MFLIRFFIRFFNFFKSIILFPFKFLTKLFKPTKKNNKYDYVSDINNLIALKLPINVVTIHFDEENGFRYDITSTQGKKALERAKNEDNEERKKEISSTEEEENKKIANTTTKKKVGRPKGSTKKIAK